MRLSDAVRKGGGLSSGRTYSRLLDLAGGCLTGAENEARDLSRGAWRISKID